MYPAIQLQGNGIVLAAGSSSTTTALPTLENGGNPKYVRIMCEENTASIGTQGIFVRTGGAAVTAIADQGLFVSMGESVILFVAGDSHIAVIRLTDSGSGSTTTDNHQLYVHPVEV